MFGIYSARAIGSRSSSEFFAGQRDKAERILEDAQKIEQDRIDINGQPENARANGALGDLIMHRMQFLFMQGRISDGERVLGSWSSKFNSTFEGRVALYITTAHAKMLVARKKLDQALAKLETIVEQPLNIVTGGALQRSDLNWATVILSQVYCFQAKYHYVITLLRPQVDALLERHSQCEYITSDFRILLCEAYIGMKQFNDASTALKSLSDDLRLPGQVGNPRAPDQLFEVKVLSARLSHVQQQWRDAVEKWMDALAFAGIDSRAAIINKTFTRTEKNMLALYSLGVARYRQGDKKVGKLYVSIAEEEPEFLAKPHGEIDYARWMGDVREEYRRVSKSPLQRFC
jgi:hypothetical protein